MSGSAIRLPNGWRPRSYQLPSWTHLEQGGKRLALVWHRRAGKDELGLHWTAVSAFQRVGTYWHMLPQAAQARKAIWAAVNPHSGLRRIDEAFPRELRQATKDQEMFIEFVNGSTWQVVGSDNYNSLVGSPPIGVVFSEYSVADPRAWDYIRPILAENGGWAIFIYTPRGRNHGAELYEMARQNPGWFAELLTVDDTKAIPASVIEEERASKMPEEMVQQEFYCSFTAGLVGAYYGKAMEAAEKAGRIGKVPWEPNLPVETWWDLGIGDSTSIWFVQTHGREIRLIDYYESNGVGLDHYAKVLAEKPYTYSGHLLPHDAQVRDLSTGRTRLETLKSLGLKNVTIGPKIGRDDGINAARVILPRCWFDAEKCARGIEALRQYRQKWDDERKTFSNEPLHDWTSHPADAFRYGAVAHRENQPAPRQTIADGDYDAYSPPTYRGSRQTHAADYDPI